jgi:glycerophosphoryl diester phosphodiesterase
MERRHATTIDVQGHRGARGLLPENSLPAFRRALEIGVTTLEMDVVISKDYQVVVSHDAVFAPDICNQPSGEPVTVDDQHRFRLYNLTYDEIRRFDCGSRGNPNFPRQEKVPTYKPLLSEVISVAEQYASENGRDAVRYNIETKSSQEGDRILHPPPRAFAELLIDIVERGGVADRTIIQSRGLDENLSRLGFDPHIYSPQFTLVSAALIDAAHDRGIEVIPWTVNDVEDMRRLIEIGADGFITDYPDVAMELVANL